MENHPETKIDCSKVYVKQSSFSNEETGMFDGAFAGVAFKEGKSYATALISTLILLSAVVLLTFYQVILLRRA